MSGGGRRWAEVSGGERSCAGNCLDYASQKPNVMKCCRHWAESLRPSKSAASMFAQDRVRSREQRAGAPLFCSASS